MFEDDFDAGILDEIKETKEKQKEFKSVINRKNLNSMELDDLLME